jgi:hypothetical protein
VTRRVRVRARRGAEREVVEKPTAEPDERSAEIPDDAGAPAEGKQEPPPEKPDVKAPPERKPSRVFLDAMARLPEHQRESFGEAVRLIAALAEQHAEHVLARGESIPFDDAHGAVLLLASRFARGAS